MKQTGKFDTSINVRDFEPAHADCTKPPDDASMSVGIGDRMKVAVMKPEILQGASIERMQFPQRGRVPPRLLQPMPSTFEHCPQSREHRDGDSIEPKRSPGIDRCGSGVICRQARRNLVHLLLAAQDSRYVVLLVCGLK